uniref:Pheromone processing endoprotease KexB (EC) n=1 Tax=Ganoderma boninense TaxID=34458 RepID=A0A5K1K067_9APHY|nr:Pheromone processing endoprotease KexB (EC [Ganoderma boninense]
MLDHRGFSAYITSNKLELVEFEPRVDARTHTVTCWIEGPAGQPFVIHWRDHGSKVDSASWIYVDGFKVSGQFLYGRGEELRRGVRVASEEERPFMFSAIYPADLHARGTQGELSTDQHVGSIVLEIRLIKRVGEREPNPVRPPPNVVRGDRQPGEVAIRYGNARPAAMQQRTYKIEPFNPKEPGPYVTFIFRYRSRDWLTSQGIIKRNVVTSRLLILTSVNLCTKADLPPLQPEEDRAAAPAVPQASGGRRVSSKSRAQPPAQASSSRLTPTPTPGPSLTLKDLGLGQRPQGMPEASRVSSATTSRSFSGTWDHRTPFNDPYEEWNEYEYRPEDLNDALDNYYQ